MTVGRPIELIDHDYDSSSRSDGDDDEHDEQDGDYDDYDDYDYSSRFSLPSPNDLMLDDDDEVRAAATIHAEKDNDNALAGDGSKLHYRNRSSRSRPRDCDVSTVSNTSVISGIGKAATTTATATATTTTTASSSHVLGQEKVSGYSTHRLRTKLSKRASYLVGREMESQEIEQAFSYICTNQRTSVVWIEGKSGTGKSCLANQLNITRHPHHSSSHRNKCNNNDRNKTQRLPSRTRRRQQRKQQRQQQESSINGSTTNSSRRKRQRQRKSKSMRRHFFSVTSKFDLQVVNEPFACIKFALTDLANQISTLPRKNEEIDVGKGSERENSKGSKKNGNDSSIYATDAYSGESTSTADADTDAATNENYYFDDIEQQLRTGLGEDLVRLLSTFIPNLVDILLLDNGNNKKEATTKSRKKKDHLVQPTNGYKGFSDQLRFALQRFLQIVTSFCPLLWIADDLHWADQASLDLIRTWIIDVRINSFLVIGCYRRDGDHTTNRDRQGAHLLNDTSTKNASRNEDKDEVSSACGQKTSTSNSHILRDMMEVVQQVHEERKIKIINIQLDEFSLEQVNELLSVTLSASAETTIELANIVHGKTNGNVFFTIQLLLELTQQGLLRFNDTVLEWEWDEMNKIRAFFAASGNVVELMQSKLAGVPQVRFSLPLAACLGSSFSWTTLKVALDGFRANNDAWQSYYTCMLGVQERNQQPEEGEERRSEQAPSRTRDSFWTDDVVMKMCLDQGLLESREEYETGTYCFVHDKIQEAALASVPVDKKAEIQFRVGQVLLTKLPRSELDKNCFLVVNLVNPHIEMLSRDAYGEMQRLDLIRLNYLAGTSAVERSAFLSALLYLSTAIGLLPVNHWEEYHNFCLDLFSSAAECCSVIGDFEKTRYYCSQILDSSHQQLTMLEKVRIYHILIDFHMNEADGIRLATDSTDLCLKVFDELGCTFPNSPIKLGLATAAGLFKAKNNAKSRWTEELIDNLPISLDPQVEATVKTFSRYTLISNVCKPELVPLLVLKNVNMAFERGVTIHTPPAFASLAMIIGCFMGDPKTGERLALHSLRLASRLQNTNRVAESNTILIAYSEILHWTKPLQYCRTPFLEAYQIGMRMGDTASALGATLYYCEFSINSGASLALIDAEAQSFSKIAEDCSCPLQRDSLHLYRQVVLNLRGIPPNTIKNLIGHDFDGQAILDRYVGDNHNVMEMTIYKIKLTTMTFFGSYKECADIILQYGDEIMKKMVGKVGCIYTAFYGSLSCYIVATIEVQQRTLALSPSSPSSPISSEDRKYRQSLLDKAKTYRSKLIKWARNGNPNCQHMVSMLNAEHIISTSHPNNVINKMNKWKKGNVINSYKHAIVLAKRLGFIQDQALINERLAEFFLHHQTTTSTSTAGANASPHHGSRHTRHTKCSNNNNDDDNNNDGNDNVNVSDDNDNMSFVVHHFADVDEAAYRFEEAKRLYKEWGADAAVTKVEERCHQLGL